MSFNTIRKATDADQSALEFAWARFMTKIEASGYQLWAIGVIDRDRIGAIADRDHYGDSTRWVRARWDRIARRALGFSGQDIRHPIGISHGYVGESNW